MRLRADDHGVRTQDGDRGGCWQTESVRSRQGAGSPELLRLPNSYPVAPIISVALMMAVL